MPIVYPINIVVQSLRNLRKLRNVSFTMPGKRDDGAHAPEMLHGGLRAGTPAHPDLMRKGLPKSKPQSRSRRLDVLVIKDQVGF